MFTHPYVGETTVTGPTPKPRVGDVWYLKTRFPTPVIVLVVKVHSLTSFSMLEFGTMKEWTVYQNPEVDVGDILVVRGQ